MAITLTKGQRVDIGLQKIGVGLGWDPNPNASSHDYDLDASAFMLGSSAASARIAVDLPVPRSPKTRTPPTDGSTAAISSASFISSWATMAVNGKVGTRT